MRHYKKVVFSLKCIEFDGWFESIMDDVCDEMVIEINYSDPYIHVH